MTQGVIQAPSIDLTQLYRQGFAVTSLSNTVADDLLARVRRQVFRYPENRSDREHPNYHLNSGLFYCDCVTEFTKPKGYGASTPKMGMGFQDEDIPFFNEFWQDLAKESYYRPLLNLGDFTQFSKQMNFYRKNEGLSWHTDHRDGSVVINCIFLTADTFSDEDGGSIDFGIAEIEPRGEFIPESIRQVGRVVPKHGVMVTINNMNPHFLHRVPLMSASKERYTLICQFGYANNVMHSIGTQGWNLLAT